MSPAVVDYNCSITEQEVIAKKEEVLNRSNPENKSSVNMSLGLLETMLNLKNYCMYNLSDI